MKLAKYSGLACIDDLESRAKVFSFENLVPCARQGSVLPSNVLKSKIKTTRIEVLDKGRNKGQKAKKRVRDVEVMMQGIAEYERALDNGETSYEYKKILKGKILHKINLEYIIAILMSDKFF